MIDTLIIGAGICGLSLAHKLINKGENVIILEKSRGVGGRIATRRIEEQGFDHGALYLPKDQSVVSLLKDLGINYSEINHNLFIPGGMTKFPKKLSEGLNIIKGQRVSGLSFANFWEIKTDEGESFQAKKIILTAPMPQALELLEKNNISFPLTLKEITYTKGLLLLLIADEVELNSSEHTLTSMRERSLHPRGYVLRASPSYSDKHFDSTDDEIHKLLISELEIKNLSHSEIKKWRYIQPEKVLEVPFVDLGQQLFLAGDSFKSPDIAGSLLSSSLLFKHLYP